MKKLVVVLLLVSGTLSLTAQTDRIDSLLNDMIYNDSDPLLMPEKPVKFNFFNTGLTFSSNSFYAGRELSNDKMYNITGHLFYYSSTGLFIGASGNWFDQLTPGYSATTLSAGYSKAVDKKKMFTFRTSYSRYLYYKPDTGSYYPYKNNFNLGLSFRKKWIGARISSNLLFGDEYKINISAGLYSRYNLVKFGKSNKIYMAPEVSAFTSSETVSTTKSGSGDGNQTTDTKEVYSMLNTQLYVPIGFSIGDFDLEFSYSVNFPTTRDAVTTYPVTSFYSISLGYMLPVLKK